MAGSAEAQDPQGRAHVSTRPPHQHEPGELPDHLPAHAHIGLDDMAETLAYKLFHALTGHHADLMGALNHMLLRLEAIQLAVAGTQGQDMESWEVIAQAPLSVDYRGRRHLLVWSAAAVSNLSVTAHGQTRSQALAAGWNVFDPPRDAMVSVASGSVFLLFRATDDVAANYA